MTSSSSTPPIATPDLDLATFIASLPEASPLPPPNLNIAAIVAGLPAVQAPPVLPAAVRPLILPKFGQTITSADTGHIYVIGPPLSMDGHFSVVFKGTDEFDDPVAIKVLKPRGTFEEDREAALGEVERL